MWAIVFVLVRFCLFCLCVSVGVGRFCSTSSLRAPGVGLTCSLHLVPIFSLHPPSPLPSSADGERRTSQYLECLMDQTWKGDLGFLLPFHWPWLCHMLHPNQGKAQPSRAPRKKRRMRMFEERIHLCFNQQRGTKPFLHFLLKYESCDIITRVLKRWRSEARCL